MGGTGPARRPGPEPGARSAFVHATARDGSTLGRQGDAPVAATRPAPASFGGLIRVADAVYGVVTRAGDQDYPHHGQWGATPVLALCGALMRAHAARVKGCWPAGATTSGMGAPARR